MAVVIEDGTGVATANAYVDVATANAYFLARNVTTWAAKTTPEKEAAIIRGTEFIEAEYAGKWAGGRSTFIQALAWPRVGVPGPDYVGLLPALALPQALVTATLEAALLASTSDLYASGSTAGAFVTEETVGPITTKYAKGVSSTDRTSIRPTTNRIEALLTPLLIRRSFGLIAARA